MAPRRALLLSAALVLLVAACAPSERRGPLQRFSKVSVEQERSTGAEADAELQKILPLIDDPIVLGFVNDIGQAIVETIEPQPFIYRFRVVKDDELNAFALPGGYIYFHTGTILRAGSLHELAGVMAHEIAHVKARHHARRSEKALLPNLLTGIAGLAAAIATGEAAPLVVSQGVNVALQLRFSREFEAEADELATTFMARAGYDPEGLARFFDRIVTEQKKRERLVELARVQIPPYLYSHPDVEGRTATALQRAERLTVTGTLDPVLSRSFHAIQARLALLVEASQTTLRARAATPDRTVTDPLLTEAERAAREGQPERALAQLAEAERLEPNDPRVPFRSGELLGEMGRPREAIAAYRRALALDPGVALTHLRIGLAYQALDDRVNAVFYLEQAVRRFERGGALHARATRALERITFPVVDEAGLADGSRAPGADTVAGHSRQEFRPGDAQVVWWARVSSRYMDRREEIDVRWMDPAGHVVQERRVDGGARSHVISSLVLNADRAPRAGIWRVEALLDGDLVDRRTFRLAPQEPSSGDG
jgi:beta-barrel assembly-enhancing protease